MKKAFRVAVVGCGAICGNHINAIIGSGEELVALCDINADASRAAAEKFSLNVNVYTDYEEMLDREKPDSVHICTPHYLHAKMSIAALERGINVLCEKPLCINRTEMEEVLRAAKKSSAAFGVCHQNRYEPSNIDLRRRAGESPVAAFGSVVWKRDADYYASGDWRGKWLTEGGGVMINQALHTLDLLQWIAGMPVSVVAHISNDHLKGEIEVEDTATALFETEDGRRLNFFATTSCGADFRATLQIRKADRTVLLADNSHLLENFVPVDLSCTDGAPATKAVWGAGHLRLISDFYRCLKNGEHFPIDAEEGAKVIRLILSMYESNGKRTTVY